MILNQTCPLHRDWLFITIMIVIVIIIIIIFIIIIIIIIINSITIIIMIIIINNSYRGTWIWQTQWDQEIWSVICKIRRTHMMNTWYASHWDQAYSPSYAKIRRTVVHHIQVHLY